MLAKAKALWAQAKASPTLRESVHVAALGFIGAAGTFLAGSGFGVHDLTSWSLAAKAVTAIVVAGAAGAAKALGKAAWAKIAHR